MNSDVSDAMDLWRRVGLEKLYEEVRKAQEAIQSFEMTLKTLPKCQKCARAALLHNIQEAGDKLSVQIISLSILSSALKDAVSASEKTHAELAQSMPTPCRCAGEPCTCHD